MSISVTEPLYQSQIDATKTIQESLMPQWAQADGTLDWLRIALPDFDMNSVVTKASTVNQLYWARHPNILRVSERIVSAMGDSEAGDPISKVDKIIELDDIDCIAFASKFGHFFIEPGSVPIYDNWAVCGLRFHFGTLQWAPFSTVYQAWVAHVTLLGSQPGLSCTLRELDHYLWLSGMYRRYVTNGMSAAGLGLSGEVQALFGGGDADDELAALLGSA